MRITAELSLYPLTDEYLGRIEAFISILSRNPDLEIVVNQMSTQIRGERKQVFRAVEAVTAESFKGGGPQVLVLKILNADLPIAEAPQIGSPP